MIKTKDWLLSGDFHSGSKTGLTTNPQSVLQERVLERYLRALEWFQGRPDVFLLNGDGTDGKDEKGKDIDMECMMDQAAAVAELVMLARPKEEVILVTGTRYHDAHKGQEVIKHTKTTIEKLALQQGNRGLKVSIRRKLKTTVNDWFMLETRHFIGGSSIPHGRATAVLKEQLWNIMNAALSAKVKGEPVRWPNLLVYSHRHFYMAVENAWGQGLILPGWQALGGIFGDEICTGHIDLGLCKLTVGATEGDGWRRDKILFLPGVVGRTESR